MTAKEIMDVYKDRSFYIIIANSGMTDVHLLKRKKIGEAANSPEEIIHNKDECFSYPHRAKKTETDCSMNSV